MVPHCLWDRRRAPSQEARAEQQHTGCDPQNRYEQRNAEMRHGWFTPSFEDDQRNIHKHEDSKNDLRCSFRQHADGQRHGQNENDRGDR